MTEDQKQIAALRNTLEQSLLCIARLQDDISSGHEDLTDAAALDSLLCVEVGHSFFPQDGVYAQMVATGALELIESNELKTQLLEIFTHLKDRNYATSMEIDSFNISFRNAVLANFRIRFSYDSDDGVFMAAGKLKTRNSTTTIICLTSSMGSCLKHRSMHICSMHIYCGGSWLKLAAVDP